MTPSARNFLVGRFKTLREQRGWSTYELARFSKLAQKTIWKFENEDVAFSLDTAEQVAHAFGYELWQLLLPLPNELSVNEFKDLMQELTRLIGTFSQTDSEGRTFVQQVADREAQRVKTNQT